MKKEYYVQNGIFRYKEITADGEDLIPTAKEMLSDIGKIEPLIQGYEEEAYAILKAGDYPLTTKELKIYLSSEKEKGRKPSAQIKDIYQMLICFRFVRDSLKRGNVEEAIYNMALAIQEAAKARIRPIEPDIFRGIKIILSASLGGKIKKNIVREKHDQWQKDADEIWKKHPTYSRLRVANELHGNYKEKEDINLDYSKISKPDTIRRIIKKK
jgi:hypothetical protein